MVHRAHLLLKRLKSPLDALGANIVLRSKGHVGIYGRLQWRQVQKMEQEQTQDNFLAKKDYPERLTS